MVSEPLSGMGEQLFGLSVSNQQNMEALLANQIQYIPALPQLTFQYLLRAHYFIPRVLVEEVRDRVYDSIEEKGEKHFFDNSERTCYT